MPVRFLRILYPDAPKSLKSPMSILFMVYHVLGRLAWKGGIEKVDIVILHRGAPDDRKTVHGRDITSVKKGHFVYTDITGRETTIPLHRILEVRVDGKAVWKRAPKA